MRFVPLRGLVVWSVILVPLACVSNTAAPPPQVFAPTTRPSEQTEFHVDVRRSIEYLASDELEGRRIGTPGISKAADYIEMTFRKLGLQPLPGLEGYSQRFTVTTGATIGASSFFRAGDKNYVAGVDFVPLSFSAEKQFDGPLVFVGYGISKSDGSYDDYEGLDVKGSVVMAMRFEPHDEKGQSRFAAKDWSEHAPLYRKARAAAEHGAVALLLVDPPMHHEPGLLMPFARRFLGETASVPVFHITPAVAENLLQRGATPDLKALQAQIDQKVQPHSVALKGVRLQGKVAVERTVRDTKNIVAWLAGKGAHADEYVVIGAHYDHLGRGGQGSLSPKSQDIHHGADDNASGTSAMLALAENYARAGPQPRSLIFLAFTAEEEGLIGSQRFVAQSPVPLGEIVAMMNLDMVGRVRNELLYIGGGGTAPSFEQILKKADDASPLALRSLGKGGFGPSDHMSFAMKKVPVLFLFSGLHADYHRPTDVPSKINYGGIDEVVKLAADIADQMLTMPKEQYVDSADVGAPRIGGAGANVTLGVVPDYSTEEPAAGGVRIQGTVPGSPAAAAGLKDGDVLVQFGDAKIQTLYDLSDQLAKGKPGQKVHLVLLRNKDRIEVDAVLAERKG